MKKKQEIIEKIIILIIGKAGYDLIRYGIKIFLEYID